MKIQVQPSADASWAYPGPHRAMPHLGYYQHQKTAFNESTSKFTVSAFYQAGQCPMFSLISISNVKSSAALFNTHTRSKSYTDISSTTAVATSHDKELITTTTIAVPTIPIYLKC
mmetsp:Transcript_36603/g.65900  ORF Transcript_36603/g.65900 Transcript_36603/m.65900 type:complete len:115 (-) Transcript_36603:467-811(-)